jgi:hypothetical protein
MEMTMMKMRLALGLLAVVSAFAVAVSPAFAEFTSHDKSSEGTKSKFATTIEGIGATVNCGDSESGPKWQIKKSGVLAEVGSLLTLKYKTLGECVTEYKESETTKEVKATSSECEWETREPKAEMLVAMTTVNTCTIKPELSKPCEVKIEPKENKNREKVTLYDSGETDENLDLGLLLSKVTVSATGEGCAPAGISSTSSATLNSAVELDQVQPGMAEPQFRLSMVSSNLNFFSVGQKKEVSVINFGAGSGATPARAGVSTLSTTPPFGAYWTSEKNTVSTCATTALNLLQSCPMEIKLTGTVRNRTITSMLVYNQGGTTGTSLIFNGIT